MVQKSIASPISRMCRDVPEQRRQRRERKRNPGCKENLQGQQDRKQQL